MEAFTHTRPPKEPCHRPATLRELVAMMQRPVPDDAQWDKLLSKPVVATLSEKDIKVTFEQKLVPRIEICDNGFPDEPRLWCWDCTFAGGGKRAAPQFKTAIAQTNVYASHLALAYFKLPLPEQNARSREVSSHTCEGRFCSRPHDVCCRPDHLVIELEALNHKRKNCKAWCICEACGHKNILCTHQPSCLFPHK